MSEYRLFETTSFQRDIGKLGEPAARRIRATLDERVYPILRRDPRAVPGAARLRDWSTPTWRLRLGTWRIFYEISDGERIVFLTAAVHRKDAYR